MHETERNRNDLVLTKKNYFDFEGVILELVQVDQKTKHWKYNVCWKAKLVHEKSMGAPMTAPMQPSNRDLWESVSFCDYLIYPNKFSRFQNFNQW